MSTPQNPARRRKQKARRTKQLDAWRSKKAEGSAKEAPKTLPGTRVKRVHTARPGKATKTSSPEIRNRHAAKKEADKPSIQPRKDYGEALDDAHDENEQKSDAENQELDDAVEMGPGGVRTVESDE